MVLPLFAAILTVYLLTVIIALIISPAILGERVTIHTYLFIRQLTGLWAGLVWTSVAIYISLVSEANDYYFETWTAFTIGVLMIYVSVSGEFVSKPYWLAVRSALYVLFSIAGLIYLEQLVTAGRLMSPTQRFKQLYHRTRYFILRWWRQRRTQR